jgi:hypothetical protein
MRRMMNAARNPPPGEANLAADAILAAVDAENPPLQLPLSQACYGMVRAKAARLETEMAAWDAVARPTAYPAE